MVQMEVLTKFRCNNYRYLAIISFRCHSDDRREEDVLLSEAKNLGIIHFVLPRFFANALNDRLLQ
jgi:hypothetical protein